MRYRWALAAIAAILAMQVWLTITYPSPIVIASLVLTAVAFGLVFTISWSSR